MRLSHCQSWIVEARGLAALNLGGGSIGTRNWVKAEARFSKGRQKGLRGAHLKWALYSV